MQFDVDVDGSDHGWEVIARRSSNSIVPEASVGPDLRLVDDWSAISLV